VPTSSRKPSANVTARRIHLILWSFTGLLILGGFWLTGMTSVAWSVLKWLSLAAVVLLVFLVRRPPRRVPAKAARHSTAHLQKIGEEMLRATRPGQVSRVRSGQRVIVRPASLDDFPEWEKLDIDEDDEGLDTLVDQGRAVLVREDVRVQVIRVLSEEDVRAFQQRRRLREKVSAIGYVEVRLINTKEMALVEMELLVAE